MTRKEAIFYIKELQKTYASMDKKVAEAIDMAIEALKDRPQGEWIKNDDFICSECGYHMIVGDGAYNFCPNCGADMKGNNYDRHNNLL